MISNLITGPGFVASHLADLLLEKGEEVYVTYRWTDNQDAFKHIKDKVHWILMDLNDLSSCIKAIEEVKPDYIFHLGAQSYPSASFIYPEETIRTNTLGTYNLLEAIRIVRKYEEELYWTSDYACKSNSKKLEYDPVIHVCSSSEVYGLVKEEDVPIKETQQFNPANPYAVGKVGTDMIALMYFTNYGLKTIRTRMFTHTGPRRTMLSAEVAFAKQIAEFEKIYSRIKDIDIKIKRQYLKDRKNKVQVPYPYVSPSYILKHGNLDSIRTWADVRDAVKAYYLLVRKGKPGEVYNIGGDFTCTVGEMLDHLISLSPLKDKITKQLDKSLLRPYDVTLQIPDCSKFKRDCPDWEPSTLFTKTMQDLLNWWRENI